METPILPHPTWPNDGCRDVAFCDVTGATRPLLAAGMEADFQGAIPLKPCVDTSGVHGGLVAMRAKGQADKAAGWHAISSVNVLKGRSRWNNNNIIIII